MRKSRAASWVFRRCLVVSIAGSFAGMPNELNASDHRHVRVRRFLHLSGARPGASAAMPEDSRVADLLVGELSRRFSLNRRFDSIDRGRYRGPMWQPGLFYVGRTLREGLARALAADDLLAAQLDSSKDPLWWLPGPLQLDAGLRSTSSGWVNGPEFGATALPSREAMRWNAKRGAAAVWENLVDAPDLLNRSAARRFAKRGEQVGWFAVLRKVFQLPLSSRTRLFAQWQVRFCGAAQPVVGDNEALALVMRSAVFADLDQRGFLGRSDDGQVDGILLSRRHSIKVHSFLAQTDARGRVVPLGAANIVHRGASGSLDADAARVLGERGGLVDGDDVATATGHEVAVTR